MLTSFYLSVLCAASDGHLIETVSSEYLKVHPKILISHRQFPGPRISVVWNNRSKIGNWSRLYSLISYFEILVLEISRIDCI